MSDFQCYNESAGKPVHVHIDNAIAQGDPTLALLANRSEEDETDNKDETTGRNCNISVRRSKQILNHRNGWVLCHCSELKNNV